MLADKSASFGCKKKHVTAGRQEKGRRVSREGRVGTTTDNQRGTVTTTSLLTIRHAHERQGYIAQLLGRTRQHMAPSRSAALCTYSYVYLMERAVRPNAADGTKAETAGMLTAARNTHEIVECIMASLVEAMCAAASTSEIKGAQTYRIEGVLYRFSTHARMKLAQCSPRCFAATTAASSLSTGREAPLLYRYSRQLSLLLMVRRDRLRKTPGSNPDSAGGGTDVVIAAADRRRICVGRPGEGACRCPQYRGR